MTSRPSRLFTRVRQRLAQPALAWPAWQRLLVLAPLLALLWLGVWWALAGVLP